MLHLNACRIVCKPTITYYDPRRVLNEACFDKFEKDLENAPFKCMQDSMQAYYYIL